MGTYTAPNLPTGASYVRWEVGAGLTIVSSNASSCTVQRSSSLNDPEYAEVRYVYSHNQQQYTMARNITARIIPVIAAGVYDLQTHQASAIAQIGRQYYFASNMPNSVRLYILEYNWELDMDGMTWEFSGETTQYDPISFNHAGTHQLRLRIRDGCEWSRQVITNIYVQ